MEPGSRKPWSNQGQSSNVQIHNLVFFASTLYLRYTTTNVLIIPLVLLETFNGSLGHFVTSALLSLLHRAFYTAAHPTYPYHYFSPCSFSLRSLGLPWACRFCGLVYLLSSSPTRISLPHMFRMSSNRSLTTLVAFLAFCKQVYFRTHQSLLNFRSVPVHVCTLLQTEFLEHSFCYFISLYYISIGLVNCALQMDAH